MNLLNKAPNKAQKELEKRRLESQTQMSRAQTEATASNLIPGHAAHRENQGLQAAPAPLRRQQEDVSMPPPPPRPTPRTTNESDASIIVSPIREGERVPQAPAPPALLSPHSHAQPRMDPRSYFGTGALPPSRPESPKPHQCGVTPITECCDLPVSFALDWFTHASAASFTICSRCYVDHIYSTIYKSDFKASRPEDGQPRLCMFSSASMKDQLFPRAIASGTLDQALDFMKTRQQVRPCPEKRIQEKRNRWACEDVDGTAICEACYEDHLRHTPFAARCKFLDGPSSNQQWFCDFSSYFIKRSVENCFKSGNWAQLSSDFRTRVLLPECPKLVNTIINERTWYISRRRPTGLQICQTCFIDYFAGTVAAHDFAPGQPQDINGTAICAMGYLNIMLVTSRAAALQDYDMFWNSITMVDHATFCDPSGTTNTVWFTTKNNPDGFVVCAACMHCIIKPFGAGRHFMLKPWTTKGDKFICSLNTGCPRLQLYLQNFVEVFLTGKGEPLSTSSATWATGTEAVHGTTSRNQDT